MTGLEHLLGIRGPYTVMLPNNNAMFAFYKENGKNSSEEFDILPPYFNSESLN